MIYKMHCKWVPNCLGFYALRSESVQYLRFHRTPLPVASPSLLQRSRPQSLPDLHLHQIDECTSVPIQARNADLEDLRYWYRSDVLRRRRESRKLPAMKRSAILSMSLLRNPHSILNYDADKAIAVVAHECGQILVSLTGPITAPIYGQLAAMLVNHFGCSWRLANPHHDRQIMSIWRSKDT